MAGRVIQGYFPGGQPPSGLRPPSPSRFPHSPPSARPEPIQRRVTGHGSPASRPAQAKGAADSFAIDPFHVGLNRGGGKPLPAAVLAKMETAFGADFSGVRIHEGPQAARIGALAFTTGTDIYFAPGRYQPDTLQGQQLLGHELTHVIQQRQGRVRAPMGADLAVVQDQMLEAEADRMGLRVAAMAVPAARAAVQMRQQPAMVTQRFSASNFVPAVGPGCCPAHARPVQAKPAPNILQRMQAPKSIGGLPGFHDGILPSAFSSGTKTTVYSTISGSDFGSVFQSSAKPTKLLLQMAQFAGVGTTLSGECNHAEDRIPFVVSQLIAQTMQGKQIPDIIEVEIEKVFISASPCSSVEGTSNKTTGCTENLINWHQNGFTLNYTDGSGMPKTTKVVITIGDLVLDHLYKSTKKVDAQSSHRALERIYNSGAAKSIKLDHLPNFTNNDELGLKQNY